MLAAFQSTTQTATRLVQLFLYSLQQSVDRHVLPTKLPLQGGHKVGERKFPEFSRLFHSRNYTIPEVIATKIFWRFGNNSAVFSTFLPQRCRNGYFSLNLLGRVAIP